MTQGFRCPKMSSTISVVDNNGRGRALSMRHPLLVCRSRKPGESRRRFGPNGAGGRKRVARASADHRSGDGAAGRRVDPLPATRDAGAAG